MINAANHELESVPISPATSSPWLWPLPTCLEPDLISYSLPHTPSLSPYTWEVRKSKSLVLSNSRPYKKGEKARSPANTVVCDYDSPLSLPFTLNAIFIGITVPKFLATLRIILHLFHFQMGITSESERALDMVSTH